MDKELFLRGILFLVISFMVVFVGQFVFENVSPYLGLGIYFLYSVGVLYYIIGKIEKHRE